MDVADGRMVDDLLQKQLAAVWQLSLVGFSENRVEWLVEAVGRVDVGKTVGHYKLHAFHRVCLKSSCIQVQRCMQ